MHPNQNNQKKIEKGIFHGLPSETAQLQPQAGDSFICFRMFPSLFEVSLTSPLQTLGALQAISHGHTWEALHCLDMLDDPIPGIIPGRAER
jgi:hypothetical protein